MRTAGQAERWPRKMNNIVQFKSPAHFERGTIFSLLQRSWGPLWNPELERNIQKFDDEVYNEPETIGTCTFITYLKGKSIGMASFDPRQAPELGIIGWNCVVPEYQNKGYGRKQIEEILRIFRQRNIQTVSVTTTDESFFVPAMHIYTACGFAEFKRENGNIEYRLDLKKNGQPEA